MSQWDLSQPYLYFNREGTDNRLWWHSYPPNMCTGMLSGLTIITLPLDCPEFCIGNPCFAPLLNWQCPALRAEDLSRVGLHLIWEGGKEKISTSPCLILLRQLWVLLAGWFIKVQLLQPGLGDSTALPLPRKLRHRHCCSLTSLRCQTECRALLMRTMPSTCQPFSAPVACFALLLTWEKKLEGE